MDKPFEFNIPKPCHMKFASMTGDDRARHCAKCNKMVHNLSAMSSAEAQNLLRSRGKVCVTCSLDSDGEVITTDYEEIREKKLMVAQCALALCLMLGLYGLAGPLVSPLIAPPGVAYQNTGDMIAIPKEKTLRMGGTPMIDTRGGGPVGVSTE